MHPIVYRRIHTSWLISILCAAIVVGVYLAQFIHFYHLIYIVSAILLVAAALVVRTIVIIPFLVIAGLLIGLFRGGISQDELVQFLPYKDKTVVVVGGVYDDPDMQKEGELRVKLNTDLLNELNIEGKVWLSIVGDVDIKRGDKITVEGKLSEGFGNFTAGMYRAKVKNVTRPDPGDFARVVRDAFSDKVREVISEPEASLGVGYLVGQKSALPSDLNEALKIAGLTHIVVASGYNLTILVRLARRLFQNISKFLSAFSAGAMIVMFMAVTGLSPSMSRAGMVAGLSMLAWYYGRSFHPLVLLPFVAATTVMYDPSYAWGDLGWQLSFAAFAGVMLVAPLLQNYFFGDKKPGIIRQIMGETISAQIITAPILVLQFGVISNVAVLANLLVLPLVPLAMLLTFLSGVFALFVPFLADIVGWVAAIVLKYMTTVTYYLADVDWAQSEFKSPVWTVALAYFVLFVICLYLRLRTKYNFRKSSIVE